MATAPDRARRTVLLLSVVFVTLGSCGVSQGLAGMTPAPALREAEAPPPNAEPSEAAAASAVVLRTALLAAPWRRALAASNIVVSALLVVAGFHLMRRAASAPWWATQACAANSLWALVEAGTQVHAIWLAQPTLAQTLTAEWDARLRASGAAADDSPYGLGASEHLVWLFMGLVVAIGALRSVLFVVLALRTRRADVRSLLAQGPSGAPPGSSSAP